MRLEMIFASLLVGLASCQLVRGGNRRMFRPNDLLFPRTAMNKLTSTIVPSAIPILANSLVEVPAVRRRVAGHVKSSSLDSVRKNFVTSYMPFCPAETIGGVDCICKESFPHVEYIEDKNTDTMVIVAINQKYKQVVVSYKLSLSIQNWLDNLNLAMVDIPEMPKGVRLHRGIYTDYLATRDQVQDSVSALLDNPRYSNHTLFVTGYSLGGGLALVSAPSWTKLLASRYDRRPIEVISYSGPRVGNAQFASYIESLDIPVTRYTNDNDMVPHTPGRKDKYVHAGAEVFGAERGNGHTLHYCSQAYDEDPKCGLGTFTRKSPIGHAFPLGEFIPLPPYCIR